MFLMGSLAWWIAGAFAVSIPVMIHLLHRQRTQPVRWGAMQFLLQSKLQQKRRKKVDHWLLMLLRMGLIAILVAMLARPLLLDGKYNPLSAQAATDIAVVIDHSLSTGRRAGDTTVFAQAVNTVNRFTETGAMRPADTLSVVLAEHQPRKFTPLPVGRDQVGRVLEDLKRLKPGMSDASIPDAVQAARELVMRGRNPKKAIIVVSDGQRNGWKVEDLSAWNGALGQRVKGADSPIKVYELPISPDAGAANVTVADLTLTPALLGTARPSQINANIANTGTKDAAAVTAKLIVNDKPIAQQSVSGLAAGQTKSVRFEHTFETPRSNWARVEIDSEDALGADNAAVASAFVWQTLPVLVIDGQLTGTGPSAADAATAASTFRTFKASRFLVQAMLSDAANPDAPPLIKPTVMSVRDRKLADLKLDEYAVVVVNDVPQLPAAIAGKLSDYARSGHGVWFILGRNTERGFIENGLASAGLFNAKLADQQNAVEKSPPLDVRDPQNVMVAALTAPEHNILTGMSTLKWWSMTPADPDAKVVLAAGTGDPLIIERPMGSNGGRVVVWSTSVDKTSAWNNWPAMPAFVPLVNVTVHHLASGQTKGMENRRLESGQPIVWSGPSTLGVGKVAITRPDGSTIDRRPVLRDGRHVLSYADTYLPGKYELRFDKPEVQPVYYGVGIDRRELDEATLTDADRAWLTSANHKFVDDKIDAAGITTALGGANKGSDLWPLLAGFVLLMLLFETFMTWRLMNRQSTQPTDAALSGFAAPPGLRAA